MNVESDVPFQGEFDLWQICDGYSGETDPTIGTMGERSTIWGVDGDSSLLRRQEANVLPPQRERQIRILQDTSATLVSKAIIEFLFRVERFVSFEPSGKGGSREDLEIWISRLLIVLRIAMVGFPAIALIGYWSHYAHPALVGTAVSIACVQGVVDMLLIRRGHHLGGRTLIPFELVVSISVAGLAYVGAGIVGRHHGLDGFLPYLMIVAGLAGAGYGLTLKSLVLTIILGLTWAAMPLGRGAIVWNDEGGFLLWFLIGGLITTTLRVLAVQLDKATEQQLIAERKAEQVRHERWLHEDIIGILERLSENRISPADQRRARRLASQIRFGSFGDTRSHGNMNAGVSDLIVSAAERGVRLNVFPIINGDPPLPVNEAILVILETLIGNVDRHAQVDSADLVIRSYLDECSAILSDAGVGFDPYSTEWSPHTKRVVADARAVGVKIGVRSGTEGSRWELSWQV